MSHHLRKDAPSGEPTSSLPGLGDHTYISWPAGTQNKHSMTAEQKLVDTNKSTSSILESRTDTSDAINMQFMQRDKDEADAAPRSAASLNKQCGACQDEYADHDMVAAPCGHYYCQACIRHMFTASMRDEALFPPRCCKQAIPIDDVADLLGPATVKLFHERKEELETKSRTYCAGCAKFILHITPGLDEAECTVCQVRTCVHCKQQAHGGECAHDEALQQVIEIAAQRGWQRCYSCQRMIELIDGCDDVSCLCGAYLCYACGAPAGLCECRRERDEPAQTESERSFRRQVLDLMDRIQTTGKKVQAESVLAQRGLDYEQLAYANLNHRRRLAGSRDAAQFENSLRDEGKSDNYSLLLGLREQSTQVRLYLNEILGTLDDLLERTDLQGREREERIRGIEEHLREAEDLVGSLEKSPAARNAQLNKQE